MDKKYYKLGIYIPESHFDDLRKALMSVDAGHIGNYDCCLSYSADTRRDPRAAWEDSLCRYL